MRHDTNGDSQRWAPKGAYLQVNCRIGGNVTSASQASAVQAETLEEAEELAPRTNAGRIRQKSKALPEVDDHYLIALAKSGNKEAYEMVCKRYY